MFPTDQSYFATSLLPQFVTLKNKHTHTRTHTTTTTATTTTTNNIQIEKLKESIYKIRQETSL